MHEIPIPPIPSWISPQNGKIKADEEKNIIKLKQKRAKLESFTL